MRKKASSSPPLVSGSSLLVIFAILCLTTFALLSLSTVQAHLRQMKSLNKAVTDYYAADCRAEEVFARLRCGQSTEVEVETILSASVNAGAETHRYTIPVSDSQALAVEVCKNTRDQDFTVTRWQVIPAGEWTPNEDLTVWDGRDPAPETPEN